jgi:antitoxin HicB
MPTDLSIIKHVKIPLRLHSQPEGGYTVTCPLLPELVTEGDSLDEALSNVNDALKAVLELYEDLQQDLPEALFLSSSQEPVEFETVLSIA